MEDDLLLGYVTPDPPRNDNTALLRPVYRFDSHRREWQPIPDAIREFPNRGFVTWVKAPPEAEHNTVWLFEYSEHDNFDPGNSRLDRYRIDFNKSPLSPIEVIRIPVRDEELVRRSLLTGLVIRFIPSHKVCVILDDQSWIGPLRLTPKDEDRNVWIVESQANPVPRVTPAPDSDWEEVTIAGARRTFLYPKPKLLARIGEVDLADDTRNLKRVLDWCRKQPDLVKDLKLTKKAIESAVEKLSDSGDELWLQRARRAFDFIMRSGQLMEIIDDFEKELLALPRVKERIAQAEQEGRAEAKAEEEARLVDEARRTLKQLQEEVNALREERNSLERDVAEKRLQLERDLDQADALLRKRLAELVQRPVESVANTAILRALLGVGRYSNSNDDCWRSVQVRPPASAMRHGETCIEDEKQLLTQVRRSITGIEGDALIGVALHSAFVSGLMPLVTGPTALAVLEAYAHHVTGGRIVWAPVTPTMLKPTDLFGDVHPATMRFMPHPAGLLDVLLFAVQPEQQDNLFLVVLDGVNRAAVDAYLLPLLFCYSTAWNSWMQRALPIVHPTLLEPSNPYAAAASLSWPKNVLLSGTLVRGAATVPLATDMWAYACLIETGGSQNVSDECARAQPTAVTLRMWEQWRAFDPDKVRPVFDELHEVTKETGMYASGAVLHACAQLEARIQPHSKSKPWRFALHSILAPYALATDQIESFGSLVEELKLGEDGVASLERLRALVL